MKLEKISNELAEKIIVYGKDKAFTVFSLDDNESYTIYHRIYEGTYYDILEIVTTDEDISDNYKETQTFYKLDPEEVRDIFGGKK